MKRVAIVTFDFYPPIGGQGRHTYELWRRLRERPDLDLRVFSPLDNELPGHTRFAPWTLRAGRHLALSAVASAALPGWCRAQGIDLVHVNGGPGGLFLLRSPGVPVVYTVHHTYAQQSALVPGEAWKRVFVPLERFAYAKATTVTGDCDSTTRTLRETLGVPHAVTVPSGVDTNIFRPTGVERVADAMLFVGRLDARKGVEHAVRALPAVRRVVPGARLCIIGGGPLEARLRAFAREQGVEDALVFLGRVSNEELVAWYNRATIVLVPSAFEGFGLSVLEAQACGTPVVATDTDGLRDLIADGETGRLVRFGEPECLAAAASELLLDAKARGALREGGLRQAEAYDWERVAERWAEVYRRAPAPAGEGALEPAA